MSDEYQKLKKLIPYSDLDYESLYGSMKSTISELIPEYNDDSDTDPGMRIFQEVARGLDVLSWRVDVLMNESLPGNATTRKPALSHAKWMNYIPTQREASSCAYEIYVINDGRSGTVPKGTKFATGYENDAIVFCTTESVVCEPPEDCGIGETYVVETTVENAEEVVDYVGVSDGSVSQVFYLENTDYIEGSIIVDVLDDKTGVVTTYEVVSSIFDIGYNEDKVLLEFDENNYGKLTFGDGVIGSIPTADAQIVARYKIGGGESGNVYAGFITKLLDNVSGLTITGGSNPEDAKGGKDIETVESINKNAPYHFVTGDRLVSYTDCIKWFESQYAVGEGNVVYEKDKTYLDVYNFYLAPNDRDLTAIPDEIKEMYMGIINGTDGNDAICMMGDEIVIKDPIWKYIKVKLSVSCSKTFDINAVLPGVKEEVFSALNNKKFGETLIVSDVYDSARSVDGVLKVRIDVMCLKSESDDIVEVDCDFNEIIRLDRDDLVVVAL